MKNSRTGAIIPFAALLTIAAAILVLFIAQTMTVKTHQSAYVENMNRAYQVAESGLNQALGRIAIEPSNMSNLAASIDGGNFEAKFFRRNTPVTGGYYIITTATRAAGGRNYVTQLHTYVRASNVGDYFAAVNDVVGISDNVDASGGKVYGKTIKFGHNVKVKSASFVGPASNCSPPKPWNGAQKLDVQIAEPVAGSDAHEPVMLNSELLFPVVSDSDISRYKDIAHYMDANPALDHTKCDFNVEQNPLAMDGNIHIFPPGYEGVIPGMDPSDDNDPAKRSTLNVDHVWYCDGDMRISGTVHGQVLFVARGDIYITGSLQSAPNTAPLPGDNMASSSTAHQAILISKKNIYINNTFHAGNVTPFPIETQVIEGVLMAPNGKLEVIPYANTDIHNYLKLKFKGSMVIGSVASGATNSIPMIFAAGREYSYMDSLRLKPPPYLPAVTEIKYSFEETLGVD